MEEEERCHRCYRPKHPASLAVIEYGDMRIRVCMQSMHKIANTIRRVRLEERHACLHAMREDWRKHYKQGEKRRRVQ